MLILFPVPQAAQTVEHAGPFSRHLLTPSAVTDCTVTLTGATQSQITAASGSAGVRIACNDVTVSATISFTFPDYTPAMTFASSRLTPLAPFETSIRAVASGATGIAVTVRHAQLPGSSNYCATGDGSASCRHASLLSPVSIFSEVTIAFLRRQPGAASLSTASCTVRIRSDYSTSPATLSIAPSTTELRGERGLPSNTAILTLRNTGGAELRWQQPSAGFPRNDPNFDRVIFSPTSGTIPPNGTQTVEVRVNACAIETPRQAHTVRGNIAFQGNFVSAAPAPALTLQVAPNDVNRFEILSLTPQPGQLQPSETLDFVMRARVSLGTHREGGAMFLIRDAEGKSIDGAFPVRLTLNDAPREIELRASRVEIPAGVTAITVTGVLYSATPVLDNIVFATEPQQYRVSPDTLTFANPKPESGNIILARKPTSFSATVSVQLRSLPEADVALALIQQELGVVMARSESRRVTSAQGLVQLPLSFETDAHVPPEDYVMVALLFHPETGREIFRSSAISYPHVHLSLQFGKGLGQDFQPIALSGPHILLPGHLDQAFETIRAAYDLPPGLSRESAPQLSVELSYGLFEQRRRRPRQKRILASRFIAGPGAFLDLDARQELLFNDSDWIQFNIRLTTSGRPDLVTEPVEFPVERVYVLQDSSSPKPGAGLPDGKAVLRARVEYNVLRPGISNLFAAILTQTRRRLIFPQRIVVSPERGEADVSLELDTRDPQLTLDVLAGVGLANADLGETPESKARAYYWGSFFLSPSPTPLRSAPGRQPLTFGAVLDDVNHALGDSTQIFSRTNRTPINPSAYAAPSKSASRNAGTPADALQFRGLPIHWEFDPPIPASQLSARLTLEFRDTPLDPSIDPSQLEIVSFDPATGTLSRHPSTVDLAAGSVTAPIAGLEPVYSLGTFATSRSQTLAIPFRAALSGVTVAQSVVNAGTEPLQLQVNTIADSGEGEAAPADASPGAQLVNSSSNSAFAGWLRIVSPRNTLAAASLLGAGALFDAIPTPPHHAGTHIFPHVEAGSGFASELHVANNAPAESVCELDLRRPDGTSSATATFLLPERGRTASRIEDLFPSVPLPFQGSLIVSCGHETASALLLQTRSTLAAMPGLRGLSKRWYAPHIAATAILHLANATPLPVRVTLRAFRNDGTPSSTPQVLTLDPGVKANPSLSTLLGQSASGALIIESDRSGIAAAIEFIDNPANPGKRSFAALLDNPSRAAVLPWIANSNGFNSTLSVFNTSTTAATVEIRSFLGSGALAGSTRQSIPPAGRLSAMLASLIAATAGQAGGYLHIAADQPIAALLAMESATSLATLPSVEAPAGIVPAPPAAPPAPPAPTPALAITPSELDFGQVRVGQTRDLTITLRNSGNATLAISDATLPGTFFTLAPRPPLTIAANEQRDLTVRFAPTAAGGQSTTLTLTTNDPARRTAAVRLLGTGVAPAATNRELTLQVDDGTFEDVIGFPDGNVNAYFIVRFTPAAYPATLKKIQVYFHATGDNLVAGDSIALLSAAHTAGETLRSPALRVTNARVLATGRFNEYEVSPLTIASGDFLVGFSVFNRPRIYPMAVDTTRPQGRSYISIDGTDFRLLRSVSNLDGNHGIRAVIEVPQ